MDSTGTFFVEETQNQVHTCKWAGNMATKMRCRFDAVKSNCPVLCGVPCRYKSESPSSSPVIHTSESPSSSPVFQGGDISESNKGTDTEKKQGFPYVIVFVTIGGVIIAAALLYAARKKDDRFIGSSVNADEEVDHGAVEEQWIGNSFASVDDHSCAYIEPVQFEKTSSFIPADHCNLGQHHSAKDVQCCTNFPCDNCQRKNNVTFVPVKMGDSLDIMAAAQKNNIFISSLHDLASEGETDEASEGESDEASEGESDDDSSALHNIV